MNFVFIHPFKLKRVPADEHTYVPHRNQHDQSEGSEFLDDAIRMDEVQFAPNAERLTLNAERETRNTES
jgi:hypothetical protein